MSNSVRASAAAIFGSGALVAATAAFPTLTTSAPYHTSSSVVAKPDVVAHNAFSDAIHVVVLGNAQKNGLGLGSAIVSAENMNNPVAAAHISGKDASQVGLMSLKATGTGAVADTGYGRQQTVVPNLAVAPSELSQA